MASGSTSPFTYVGTLGELYAEIELLKRGLYAQKMSNMFDFDLLTTNNKRVEVKTAKPTHSTKIHKNRTYKWEIWQFRNYDKGNIPWHEQKGRNRECDFYMLMCLNDEKELDMVLIVPQNAIGARLMITVSKKKTSKLLIYKNAWHLLK